ncbi:hypothetical protein CVT26_005498, partial [Gymnopilus dilepis]
YCQARGVFYSGVVKHDGRVSGHPDFEWCIGEFPEFNERIYKTWALYSTNASVLMLGMRCASRLAKCPLKNVQKLLPVTVRRILDIIRLTGNAELELAHMQVKDRKGTGSRVPFLNCSCRFSKNQRVKPQAFFACKVVVAEIYNFIKKVSVQGLCRAVLLHFLGYIQDVRQSGNEMTFLANNLSYVYKRGRIKLI